jgi:hypothetical protein
MESSTILGGSLPISQLMRLGLREGRGWPQVTQLLFPVSCTVIAQASLVTEKLSLLNKKHTQASNSLLNEGVCKGTDSFLSKNLP